MFNNNKIKKTLKASNGITLIALVITIIVLLILAGISITMLSGDNSILSQAGRARDLTEEKSEEEIQKIESMIEAINTYTSNTSVSSENEVTILYLNTTFTVQAGTKITDFLDTQGVDYAIQGNNLITTNYGGLRLADLSNGESIVYKDYTISGGENLKWLPN